jgi:uncharacterized protein (TIGR02246 family)
MNKATASLIVPGLQGGQPEIDPADQKTLRELREAQELAYNLGDAQLYAELYTADGDYQGPTANAVCQGRKDIRKGFAERFAANKGNRIQFSQSTLYLLKPGLILDKGIMELTDITQGKRSKFSYSTFYTRDGGKWRILHHSVGIPAFRL